MKTLYRIFAVGLLVAALATVQSCRQLVTIDPQNSKDFSSLATDSTTLEEVLVGAYSLALSTGAGYGTDFIMVSDLMGSPSSTSYVSWNGTFSSYRDLRNRNQVSLNATATRMWTNAYRAISQCNSILQLTDNLIQSTAARNRIKGEARFIRGIVYYELIRYFARHYTSGIATPATNPGVPLVLTPLEPAGEDLFRNFRVPRSTVQQVYDQILLDLTTAKGLLPAQNLSLNTQSAGGVGRATSMTSAAWLARVYLSQNNPITNSNPTAAASAAAEANFVITSGLFALATNPLGAFNAEASSTNTEAILEMQYNAQNNINNGNDGLPTFYLPSELNGRNHDVRIGSGFVATFPSGDARANQFLVSSTSGAFYTTKWSPVSPAKNIVICRLAEMYLIRAEATLVTNPANALADVNTIRARAGAPALAGPITATNVLDERRLELCFEGHRLHDSRRFGQNITGTFTVDNNFLVLPIPQREIDAYNASGFSNILLQNPSY